MVANPNPTPIKKPETFSLSSFTVTPATAMVQRMPMALPTRKISDVGDFVRLHPDDRPPEEGGYWSGPLAFVDVPVKARPRR